MVPFRYAALALLLALQPFAALTCMNADPLGPDEGAAISVGRMAGVTWVAVTVHGKALPAGVDAWFSVSPDGVVSGRTGCNSFGGVADLDAGRIAVGSLTATEMGCDDALMRIEAAYLAALAEVTSFAVSPDGFLYLGRADGATALCFRP